MYRFNELRQGIIISDIIKSINKSDDYIDITLRIHILPHHQNFKPFITLVLVMNGALTTQVTDRTVGGFL